MQRYLEGLVLENKCWLAKFDEVVLENNGCLAYPECLDLILTRTQLPSEGGQPKQLVGVEEARRLVIECIQGLAPHHQGGKDKGGKKGKHRRKCDD